jgi:hypothetical protein
MDSDADDASALATASGNADAAAAAAAPALPSLPPPPHSDGAELISCRLNTVLNLSTVELARIDSRLSTQKKNGEV